MSKKFFCSSRIHSILCIFAYVMFFFPRHMFILFGFDGDIMTNTSASYFHISAPVSLLALYDDFLQPWPGFTMQISSDHTHSSSSSTTTTTTTTTSCPQDLPPETTDRSVGSPLLHLGGFHTSLLQPHPDLPDHSGRYRSPASHQLAHFLPPSLTVTCLDTWPKEPSCPQTGRWTWCHRAGTSLFQFMNNHRVCFLPFSFLRDHIPYFVISGWQTVRMTTLLLCLLRRRRLSEVWVTAEANIEHVIAISQNK